MNEAPRPPRELNPELSPEIEAVVLSALEKDMNLRPTAAQFANDFAAALGLESPGPFEGGRATEETEPGIATESFDLASGAARNTL